MNILTLNAGSNSLKFEVISTLQRSPVDEIEFGSSLLSGAFDDIGKPSAAFRLLEKKRDKHRESISAADHGEAAEWMFRWLEDGNARAYNISGLADIDLIGHRIVHGADQFHAPVRITPEVIAGIEALQEFAPLHTQSVVKVIKAAQSQVGARIEMFAVFDTAFHRSIPDEAALYALPLEMARRHRIRRYGFHGISHRYMTLRYAQLARRPSRELNLVTLHLEGGSSAAAVRGGRSMDTSMGMTPLEGLMMGTRCGDLDPSIVPYLMRKEHMDAAQIEEFLNKRCGLAGVSQLSADTRELVKHRDDRQAALALEMFCYRCRKYIGAYLAAMGGAHAVILGGGIAENTPLVREQICEQLAWSGAILDKRRNTEAIDREACISTPESSIEIWVIPTEEGLMMAGEIAACV